MAVMCNDRNNLVGVKWPVTTLLTVVVVHTGGVDHQVTWTEEARGYKRRRLPT